MALVVQKKSTQSNSNEKKKELGKAPDDIYDLEREIESITLHDSNSQTKDENTANHDEYKLFTTSNVSEAKQCLGNGAKIKINLPNNISPHALIGKCAYLGFDTAKMTKLFQSSSVVVKNILDEYVSDLQSKYSSLSNISHPYQASAYGYLYHCKQIDALQCAPDLSAKTRITMNCDYQQTVVNDDLFETKFKYELANKVFKCPIQNIQIQDVRAGSVIVVITGITLITLAAVGLVTFTVKLHQKKQQQRLRERQKSLLPAPAPASIVSVAEYHDANQTHEKQKQMNVKKLDARKYTEVKRIPSKPSIAPQTSFMSSIFNRIKSGISSFNEQYAENTKPTPGGAQQQDTQDMKAKLVAMGFKQHLCDKAVVAHPNDMNNAINWIIEHENDADNANDDDVVYNHSKSSIVDSASSKGVIEESKEMERENLLLNINDLVWVNKKNQLWSATVIALTRDKVTIEYDNGGPYLWQKTETFALNDPCLSTKEPGMPPDIEGCITVSKSNGGYIKAWKTGLSRPMADI